MDINALVRPNIAGLSPYSSARNEYDGDTAVLLDANENPFESAFNRYPDPLQSELKLALAKQKGISVENIFIGNGSDEAIDLLFRIFCNPAQDNVITITPSYGMYNVSAAINDVEIREVPLTPSFDLDTDALLNAVDANTKLIFLCSPNNPTGNTLDKDAIFRILNIFNGIVVLDEAYIDFADTASGIEWLNRFENLIVLQTFSKARGLAGLRVGMAYASPQIIGWMNKVKPPYNVNSCSQQLALEALDSTTYDQQLEVLISEREALVKALKDCPLVIKVYPSQANFLLVAFNGANALFGYLIAAKIVVRNRTKQVPNGLRISVGTPEENKALMNAINNFTKQQS